MVLCLILAVGGWFVVRRGGRAQHWHVLGGMAVILGVVWWIVRPVAKGKPVEKQAWLLEIQSPYCLACLAEKSKVDRVEREFEGKLLLRRVDIQSAEGKKLSEKYGIERTPSFIFFDADGEEQWRSEGGIDLARVRASLGEGAK